MIICALPECQTSAGCQRRCTPLRADGIYLPTPSREYVDMLKAEIVSLRSRAEKAESELLTMTKKFNGAVGLKEQQRMRAEYAEATCEKLAKALESAFEVLTAEDGCDLTPLLGSDNPNEHAAGLVADALATYRKEASE